MFMLVVVMRNRVKWRGIYMERIETPYGILEGATNLVYYKNGSLRSCQFEEPNQITTFIGNLIPQHGEITTRTKFREAISFYETGELKSIYLKVPISVNTTVGEIKCEFITFYKEGMVHRLFPLYGQMSGYWSEEEEYQLAEKASFKIGDIQVDRKINSYCFYPSGHLKSLSLWNKEILMIKFHKKNVAVRLGIAFYENGNIKSIETYVPTKVKTPIGDIMAYSNEAIGIHGDTNSLILDEDGNIKGITTVSTSISMRNALGEEKIMAPHLIRSKLDIEKWTIAPITINFLEDQVKIRDENTTYIFKKSEFEWSTAQIGFKEIGYKCSNCKGCKGCS